MCLFVFRLPSFVVGADLCGCRHFALRCHLGRIIYRRRIESECEHFVDLSGLSATLGHAQFDTMCYQFGNCSIYSVIVFFLLRFSLFLVIVGRVFSSLLGQND